MRTEDAKINVDCNDLQEIVIAIHDLSDALFRNRYDVKAEYVLQENASLSAGQNAINFVENNMEVTGAALRLIAEATGILTRAFINSEIAITAHTATEE